MGPWAPTDTTEWWPYPILDFITSVDVAPHSSQPLLLTVTPSSASAQAGNYSVLVTLKTKERIQHITLEVEIYSFALPLTPSLPTFWGVSERDNYKIWPKSASTPAFAQRFVDFLLDHRLPVSSLYGGFDDWNNQTTYSVGGLQHLWTRGQRNFNLASLQLLPVTPATEQAFYGKVAAALTLIDIAGIPRNATSVYIMDESPADVDAAVIPRVSAEVKRRFGRGVQVVTCGQNQWWLRRSEKQPFPDVDIFIPPLSDHILKGWATVDGFGASFANTTAAMKKDVRAKGQAVGL